MKRYIILIVIVLTMPILVSAQDLVDALRYSDIQVSGTARAGAMGNAFGALGGDFTSAGINPAGLGLYRSGEFAITPISMSTKVETEYYRNPSSSSDYKFSLNNFSYVGTIPVIGKNEAGIVSVNLGAGYNRVKDFNSYSNIQANGVNGSYMDYFTDRANRGTWSDFYEELAWQTDMIFKNDNNEYRSDPQNAGYGQNQRKSYSRSGSIDEYSFVASVNFNHKLYMGMSWGINDLYYRETTSIYENDERNISPPYFNNFQFNNNLTTYGIGHNFKFGVIYKPVNQIRLGIAIHTPTYYHLHDDFQTSMSSSITYTDGSDTYDKTSPFSQYDYHLQTPFRTTFSGAFVIGKKGIISADYELLNYANAKLKDGGDGADFYTQNNEINEAYKTSENLRIGGELMATGNIAVRGGFEYHGSAYNSTAFNATQQNADANLLVYSGGLGYRVGSFFADVSYRFSTITQYEAPYPTPVLDVYPIPEMASFKTTKNDVLFTLGFKF